MSLLKIVIILIVVIIVGAGIAMYLWSMPGAYAPAATDQAVAPVPAYEPSEEQELGAIPVDDLGKEMQDISRELAR